MAPQNLWRPGRSLRFARAQDAKPLKAAWLPPRTVLFSHSGFGRVSPPHVPGREKGALTEVASERAGERKLVARARFVGVLELEETFSLPEVDALESMIDRPLDHVDHDDVSG